MRYRFRVLGASRAHHGQDARCWRTRFFLDGLLGQREAKSTFTYARGNWRNVWLLLTEQMMLDVINFPRFGHLGLACLVDLEKLLRVSRQFTLHELLRLVKPVCLHFLNYMGSRGW